MKKRIYLLSIIISILSITSCEQESITNMEKNNEEQLIQDNESILSDKIRSKKVYHFIRFNVKNSSLIKRYITMVKNLAKKHSG